MNYVAYNTLLNCVAPLVRIKLRHTKRHATLLNRFNPAIPKCGDHPIWVHACSVGEVNTAQPLISELNQASNLLLTTSTVTGFERAKNISPVPVTWCPFDTLSAVRCFLDTVKPRALLLIETEVWPNLLRECHRRGISTLIVNGRLSDKHFKRYNRWMRSCFKYLSATAVQDQQYAERMSQLGVEPANIEVCGNLKYDTLVESYSTEKKKAIRREAGFGVNTNLVVFGSTRPGDEEIAALCWERLAPKIPDLRFVIAPRHPERAKELPQIFSAECQFRSDLTSIKESKVVPILILDTLGELLGFYSIANVAVIGGSILPGVEGHNPMEPAALGVPVLFGSHMANFREPAQILLESSAAIRCDTAVELADKLEMLLKDPPMQRQMGTRARRAVLKQQGASKRTVQFLIKQGILEPPAQ